MKTIERARAAIAVVGLAGAACSAATPNQTASISPSALPSIGASPTACAVTVEPPIAAPGGWGNVVGAGFRPGERVSWTSRSEDGTITDSWDSDGFDQMVPDVRGGFGFGLGAPGEEAVGHAFTATITSESCSTSATWRVEAENEQTKPLPAVQPEPCTADRVSVEQTDDSEEHQVHVIYALPSEATDRHFDTNGRIAAGFEHMRTFLRERLAGHAFRLDTCDGLLDVTFLRLPRTGPEYAAMRNGFNQGRELDLVRAGFRYGNKLYAVIWDGLAQWARMDEGCGGEAGFHGVAVLFLRTNSGDACPLLGAEEPYGEPDTGLAHEMVHVLGLPAQCAAHVDESGHVTDEPADLMYGIGHSMAEEIDAGHDDYYGHEIADCPDLADSAFLDPLPANPQLPAGWPTGSGSN